MADNNTIHITPINDIKPHLEKGTDCECNPEAIEESGTTIIVHNSFDGRELFEPDRISEEQAKLN